MVFSQVCPGIGCALLFGNIWYMMMAAKLSTTTGRLDHTALPYGINTPAGFLTVYMVMLPVCFKCAAPRRAARARARRRRAAARAARAAARAARAPAARARQSDQEVAARALPSLSPKLADMYGGERPATPEEFAQKAWQAACLANFIGGLIEVPPYPLHHHVSTLPPPLPLPPPRPTPPSPPPPSGGRHHPRRADPQAELAEGGALRADLRRRLRLARLQPPHRRDARAPHRLPPARPLLHRLLRRPRRRRVHAQDPGRPPHLRRRDHPLVARPRALGHGEPQRPQRRPQPARVDGEDPRADVGDDGRREQLAAGHRPRRRAHPPRDYHPIPDRDRVVHRDGRERRGRRDDRRDHASSTARCSSSSPTATT